MSVDVKKENGAVPKGVPVHETLFGLYEGLRDLSKPSLASAFLGQTRFYDARRGREGLQADIASVSSQIWAQLESGEEPTAFELNELKLRCALLASRSEVAKLRATRLVDLTPVAKLEKHEHHLNMVERRLKIADDESRFHSHVALESRLDVVRSEIDGRRELAREGRKVFAMGSLSAIALGAFAWFASERNEEPDIAEPQAQVQPAAVKPQQEFSELDID